MIEFVWVVRREVLFSRGTPTGFVRYDQDELAERYLAPAVAEGFFMERRYAETHPEYKQLIPYVAVQRGDELLCLTRLETQGERRLHGLRSIGVGGHVNPCDAENGTLLRDACLRELHEELVLSPGHLEPAPMGILNDDTTEVGAVHFGIVYTLDATGTQVSVRETSAMAGDFEPLAELQAAAKSKPSPFESWSTLLLGAWEHGSPAGGGSRIKAGEYAPSR